VSIYLRGFAARALLGSLLGLVTVCLLGAGFYFQHWFTSPLNIENDVKVELASGQSFSSFAQDLATADILDFPTVWSWRARFSGAARQVKAGEYLLQVGDTPASLLGRLQQGDVVTYQVQLIEGWTVQQALGALRAHPALIHELEGVDVNTLLSVLGLPPGHAEGLFFPDTYQFERGASDADILRRAYSKLQQELAEAWTERDAGLPYATPYEALIAASLIEKETGRETDRARIAQVFVARLERGMRLQTDPSVIYGVGMKFNGDLTRRHLREDTPYNTYTRRGLPPTPIALVGANSLHAALHPATGDYLYFVARGDGSSEFSLSLEEHEAAVRKYQLQ